METTTTHIKPISSINKYKLGELPHEYIKSDHYYTYVEPNFVGLVQVIDKYHNKNACYVKVVASVGKKMHSDTILIASGYGFKRAKYNIHPKEYFFEQACCLLEDSVLELEYEKLKIEKECYTLRKKITSKKEWAQLITLKMYSQIAQSCEDQLQVLKENNTLFNNVIDDEEFYVLTQINISKVIIERPFNSQIVGFLNYKFNLLINHELLDNHNSWENFRADIARLIQQGYVFKKDQRVFTQVLDLKYFYFNFLTELAHKRRLKALQDNDMVNANGLMLMENQITESTASINPNLDFTEFFKEDEEKVITTPIIEDYTIVSYMIANLFPNFIN